MAETLTTPVQRRDAVLRAMKVEPVNATGSSEPATCDLSTPACVLIGVDPQTVRREHPPERAIEGATGSSPMASADIRFEMNKIAEKRQFGYRRIGVMLERVGMVMNERKLCRI